MPASEPKEEGVSPREVRRPREGSDPNPSRTSRREVQRLASEARHEALRLLREQFPLTYQELHEQAKAKRGLGGVSRDGV